MKPAPFTYHAAHTADEALTLLDRLGEDARVMAGGQSLGPMLNLRAARPTHVVDISRIPALRQWRQSADGTLHVGAAVSHAEIEDAPLAGRSGELLRRVASGIAYRSVRNRGTIGGSLAHADPAADWPPTLCALGAQVHVASSAGERTIAMRDFVQGCFETAISSDEIVTSVEVPSLPGGTRWSATKHTTHHGGFAAAIAICVMPPGQPAVLWLGAVGERPLDLSGAIGSLSLHPWGTEARAAAYAAIGSALEPVVEDGEHVRYRRHLHAVNAADAIEKAVAP